MPRYSRKQFSVDFTMTTMPATSATMLISSRKAPVSWLTISGDDDCRRSSAAPDGGTSCCCTGGTVSNAGCPVHVTDFLRCLLLSVDGLVATDRNGLEARLLPAAFDNCRLIFFFLLLICVMVITVPGLRQMAHGPDALRYLEISFICLSVFWPMSTTRFRELPDFLPEPWASVDMLVAAFLGTTLPSEYPRRGGGKAPRPPTHTLGPFNRQGS